MDQGGDKARAMDLIRDRQLRPVLRLAQTGQQSKRAFRSLIVLNQSNVKKVLRIDVIVQAKNGIAPRLLVPDRYNIAIGIHRPNIEVYDVQERALGFNIEEVGSNMSRYQGERYGVILVNFPWKRRDMAGPSNGVTGRGR